MDGSDIKLYLSWKPDRVDKRLQEFLRQGDEGRARQLSQALSSMERLWKGFVIDQSRGELISLIGDGVNRACIPAEALEGVEKIRAQASRFLTSPLSVGVGLNMVDADLALQVAVKRGGDQIQLWDRETMGPELEQPAKQLQKADGPPGPQPEQPPSNKGNAGGGFTPRSEGETGEKPVPPRAEGSEHSQGEVAQAAAQEFSGPEATHGAGGGDPEQAFAGHADAQEEDDERERGEVQAQDGVRAKVVEILKQVRQAAPQLEQLKQASPDLYTVLMDMTQALILTARAMVGGDDGQQEGQEGNSEEDPVQKAELAKTWPQPITPEDQGGTDPLRDPRAQKDAQALEEIAQDTVMSGDPRAQVVADKKAPKLMPKPQGAAVSGNKRVINSEKQYRSPPQPSGDGPGWEMTAAASDRTEEAARFNETQRGSEQAGYPGQEPASRTYNIHARGGFPVGVRDRDTTGGWGEAWGNAEGSERKYWQDLATNAQNQAFPIPEQEAGPDTRYRYRWMKGDAPNEWHISSEVYGPRGSAVEGFWTLNPDGTLKEGHVPGGNSADHERHLLPWLASLGGLHKSEQHQAGFRNKITGDILPTGSHHDVDQLPGGEFNPEDFEEGFIRKSDGEFVTRDELQKGKLPMPEYAPKFKFKHPVGASKDGKIKIRHQDGTSSWVSVRAGQVLSNDGHSISSRNPDGR